MTEGRRNHPRTAAERAALGRVCLVVVAGLAGLAVALAIFG